MRPPAGCLHRGMSCSRCQAPAKATLDGTSFWSMGSGWPSSMCTRTNDGNGSCSPFHVSEPKCPYSTTHLLCAAKDHLYAEAGRVAAESGANAVDEGFAIIDGVRRLQCHIRRHIARRDIMRRLGRRMLAVPGTILGESGWYEYMCPCTAHQLVVWCAAGVDGWEVKMGPMRRKVFARAMALTQRHDNRANRIASNLATKLKKLTEASTV